MKEHKLLVLATCIQVAAATPVPTPAPTISTGDWTWHDCEGFLAIPAWESANRATCEVRHFGPTTSKNDCISKCINSGGLSEWVSIGAVAYSNGTTSQTATCTTEEGVEYECDAECYCYLEDVEGACDILEEESGWSIAYETASGRTCPVSVSRATSLAPGVGAAIACACAVLATII